MTVRSSFLRSALVALLCSALSFPLPALANGLAPVAINGTQLTVPQLRQLEAQLGSRIAPGNYLVNARGCWVNLPNGTSGCIGQGSTDTFSRYGSGERTSDGSWNHWSNAAGGAVGGTSDGCVYTTFGWSNC